MASMHGSYRRVEETVPALALIGETLAAVRCGPCHRWLDEPVSNSGRLRGIILNLATERGWSWTVELTSDPDHNLRDSKRVIATADGPVLDGCGLWCNLACELVTKCFPSAPIVDLREPSQPGKDLSGETDVTRGVDFPSVP